MPASRARQAASLSGDRHQHGSAAREDSKMIAITYTQAQQNQIATLAEEQPRPQRTDEEWDAEVLAWKRQLWQIRDLPERVLGPERAPSKKRSSLSLACSHDRAPASRAAQAPHRPHLRRGPR